MKSLGLAYLSPQNKSLAQSFRYMRTKPTIIAFKTPSLENCEYEVSPNASQDKTSTEDKVDPAPQVSLAAAEEGRLDKKVDLEERMKTMLGMGKNQFSAHPAINYPVGKPLEVCRFVSEHSSCWIFHPEILDSEIFEYEIFEPEVLEPDFFNLILDPEVFEPEILNPEIF